MISYIPPKEDQFIGRDEELQLLCGAEEPFIVVVYGRRRIGKTTLLEHAYQHRNLLKFEGIQTDILKHARIGSRIKEKDQQYQLNKSLKQLVRYLESDQEKKMYENWNVNSWSDFFELLYELTKVGQWTLFFEEVQWLASYSPHFFSELKECWDNLFRKNPKIGIIISGSSPSFIMNQIVSDKALYGRITLQIHLKEFNLIETEKILGGNRSNFEVMDAILTVGGIPEYLKILKKDSSVFLSLYRNSFLKNSYFLYEKEKIFTSSMANSKHYEKILNFLSKRKYATLKQIKSHLKTEAGSPITDILEDLIQCDFIEKYIPLTLSPNSNVLRFCIKDNYLQFYFKFISPIHKEIEIGNFNETSINAINQDDFKKWLGFAFERWCRTNYRIFTKILGFQGIKYKTGSFFNKGILTNQPGFQIDLMFVRSDRIITICEIKYHQDLISASVISDVEEKIRVLQKEYSKAKTYTIQKVLITTLGGKKSLIERHYFDRIITIEESRDIL
ncbi:MAG: AAA family ATPase [archaeon]|nr:AAA family ATPase [archaeon]